MNRVKFYKVKYTNFKILKMKEFRKSIKDESSITSI